MKFVSPLDYIGVNAFLRTQQVWVGIGKDKQKIQLKLNEIYILFVFLTQLLYYSYNYCKTYVTFKLEVRSQFEIHWL